MEFLDSFNGENGELVRSLTNPELKGVKAEKALIAMKNHSDAERRRRQRINGHLNTLRTLIPGTSKMDKAALLAEAIKHVKELKTSAEEATRGILSPMDTDEIKIEYKEHGSIIASLCCDYKHQLLYDLKQALETIHIKTIRAEIATFESRMVNLFVISGTGLEETDGRKVHQAFKSVLDKFYASEEFLLRNTQPSKRRRVSLFNPLSSSSSLLEDFW